MSRLQYESLVRAKAAKYGLDPEIIVKQVETESNFDPNARSRSDARGLMQLMFRYYGHLGDLFDPELNVETGCRLMRVYRRAFGGDYAKALAAYNGGQTAIQNWVGRFGDGWRGALVTNRDEWRAIATYGDAKKADQVARYVTLILGPETTEEAPPMTIVDQRGQLPTFGGASYDTRPLSWVQHCVIHYTAGPASQSVREIAAYQASAAAAGQTGTGQPFPAIAYHYLVDGNGTVHRCHNLTVETWHKPGKNSISYAVCYTGNSNPSVAQRAGIAIAIHDAETILGRTVPIEGHKDGYSTSCPGPGWPAWKADIESRLDGLRAKTAPPAPDFPNHTFPDAAMDETYTWFNGIGAECHEYAETVQCLWDSWFASADPVDASRARKAIDRLRIIGDEALDMQRRLRERQVQ